MRPSLRSGLSAVCLCLLALPAAAAIRTEGAQVRVNGRTDFQQKNPATAFSATGTTVVAWENDQRGIRAQFYKVSGMPAGQEVTLVSNPDLPTLPFAGILYNRRDPAVAYSSTGDLLVAWTEERAYVRSSYFSETRRIEEQDVLVQRFSASGSPLGDRFRVNAGAAGLQRTPRLVARPGGFFAAWEDVATGSIVGRALDASGKPVGDDIAIGEGTGQLRPALASNGRNRILVAWDGPDENQLGVFGRLLDNAGAPVGSAFRISTTTAYRQMRPAVAADGNGDFLVAFQSEQPEEYLGFFYVYGQAVGAQGGLIGPQVRLYAGSVGAGAPQLAPALAAMTGGHFALSWIGWKSGRINVAAVELDALGAPVGDAVWISERQIRPTFRDVAVTANADGRVLISWESSDQQPSIAARRLNVR
ncbi:MAG TPA: hypothetical protein VGS57_05725 [Thermoanaerobaculia bacterium]|jgi:hypothetical protein|nr:hypothetical protein [Thermoanaerobaculia bacterium]